MLARAQYEKELKEQGSEEESDLEVYEEDKDADMEDETPEEASTKLKGKEKATAEDQPVEVVGRKRRRPPMDPFQGKDRTFITLHYLIGTSFNRLW